jgi:hypothetical protein
LAELFVLLPSTWFTTRPRGIAPKNAQATILCTYTEVFFVGEQSTTSIYPFFVFPGRSNRHPAKVMQLATRPRSLTL